MDGFRSVMSRDWFMTILRFLHETDNTRAKKIRDGDSETGFRQVMKLMQWRNTTKI
jgi:hypothetical protein